MTTMTAEKCSLGCNAVATERHDFFERELPVCKNWQIRHNGVTGNCDFCNESANFRNVYDQWGIGHWLEGIDGAGSDWLAIWCGSCGPKHRKVNH